MSYGQTSSGKTYTMFGSDWDTVSDQKSKPKVLKQNTFYEDIEHDTNFAGIIPRTLFFLYS